jgi:hypothetical protein
MTPASAGNLKARVSRNFSSLYLIGESWSAALHLLNRPYIFLSIFLGTSWRCCPEILTRNLIRSPVLSESVNCVCSAVSIQSSYSSIYQYRPTNALKLPQIRYNILKRHAAPLHVSALTLPSSGGHISRCIKQYVWSNCTCRKTADNFSCSGLLHVDKSSVWMIQGCWRHCVKLNGFLTWCEKKTGLSHTVSSSVTSLDDDRINLK